MLLNKKKHNLHKLLKSKRCLKGIDLGGKQDEWSDNIPLELALKVFASFIFIKDNIRKHQENILKYLTLKYPQNHLYNTESVFMNYQNETDTWLPIHTV